MTMDREPGGEEAAAPTTTGPLFAQGSMRPPDAGPAPSPGRAFYESRLRRRLAAARGDGRAAGDLDEADLATGQDRVDVQTRAALLEAIGGEDHRRLLSRFYDDLALRFGRPRAIDAALARDAHAVVGMAGILGYGKLARLCLTLQSAARKGDDLATRMSLELVRAEVRQVCAEIAGMGLARSGG